MDPDRLLSNLAIAFDNSDPKQAQNLVKNIIHLAAQKLGQKKCLKSHQHMKSQQSIRFVRKLFNKKRKNPKIRFISKAKLRRIAIRRVANKNRKVHESFVKPTPIKPFQFDIKPTQTTKVSVVSFEKQEQKLQSDHEEIEDFSLYPQNYESRKSQKQLKKQKGDFQKYLKSSLNEAKTDEITCPVCIEVLIDPVSTICGHSFCYRCLDESLLFGSTCPVCRLMIKGSEISSCTYLEDLIKAKLPQFLDNEAAIETYKLRKTQNDEWKKTRLIDPSKIHQGFFYVILGDQIDVRDTEHIWCKAVVLKVYTLNDKVTSILVHYQQWAKIYDEIIQIKSIRLAPKNFFSSRTDIPRYNLGNEEQNLRGAVITGNNNEIPAVAPLRNPGNEFAFSNIVNLANLRSRLSSLQNNVVNEFVPIPLIHPNREVAFMHQVIDSDSDEGSGFHWGRANGVGRYQGENDEDEELGEPQSSSLGSFAFGQVQESIQLEDYELENVEDDELSEIGLPAELDDYISIHDSEDNGNEESESNEYWNARPIVELVEMEQEEENEGHESSSLEFLSPNYRRYSQENNQLNEDEISYDVNSDHY